jgi:serine/threonine protein kinase
MARNAKYTLDIGSRWYKAPELLFGLRKYQKSIDVWSLACILAELIQASLFSTYREHSSAEKTGPLFQGISDIDQMVQISNFMGTPNLDNWKDIE